MRKDSLQGLNLVCIADLLDLGGDILVQTTDLDCPGGSKESIVGSQNDIGSLSLCLSSDDEGVSGTGGVSVDVSSELDLDDVFVLESLGLLLARGEVAADFVDRNAAWECDSSL